MFSLSGVRFVVPGVFGGILKDESTTLLKTAAPIVL